jgi:hypothetical protein
MWSSLSYNLRILPEKVSRSTSILGQNSLSPGRDFNPGSLEYEAGSYLIDHEVRSGLDFYFRLVT